VFPTKRNIVCLNRCNLLLKPCHLSLVHCLNISQVALQLFEFLPKFCAFLPLCLHLTCIVRQVFCSLSFNALGMGLRFCNGTLHEQKLVLIVFAIWALPL